MSPRDETYDPRVLADSARSIRVLLVDNDPQVLRAIGHLLASAGHAVRAAATVVDARRVLEDETIDAVVSDLELGVGLESGADLLAEIARRWPSIRRVLVSGSPEALERVGAGLAEAMLTKPMTLAELETSLRGGDG